jgi:Fe-S-cluster-containing hydrogenase component 2
MLIIVTHCTETWETCFCASMESGPRATGGFDIGITEILEGSKHHFIVEGGTERGRALVVEVALREATSDEWNEALQYSERARESLSRSLPTEGLPQFLMSSLEHTNWDNIAERCLSCANCTMVCPTCFCSTIEDTTGFSPDRSERWRRWISCFEAEFSAIHSGVVRSSTRSRYRQWLTHKLATWWSQYGTSGCVGCGRCITWCPVGIDMTEEVRKFRESKLGEEVSDEARSDVSNRSN